MNLRQLLKFALIGAIFVVPHLFFGCSNPDTEADNMTNSVAVETATVTCQDTSTTKALKVEDQNSLGGEIHINNLPDGNYKSMPLGQVPLSSQNVQDMGIYGLYKSGSDESGWKLICVFSDTSSVNEKNREDIEPEIRVRLSNGSETVERPNRQRYVEMHGQSDEWKTVEIWTDSTDFSIGEFYKIPAID
jgi:hypothetical protein